MGGRANGGADLGGAHQHSYLDQSMLKNAYFLKKTVQFASASGVLPPNPRVVTPA